MSIDTVYFHLNSCLTNHNLGAISANDGKVQFHLLEAEADHDALVGQPASPNQHVDEKISQSAAQRFDQEVEDDARSEYAKVEAEHFQRVWNKTDYIDHIVEEHAGKFASIILSKLSKIRECNINPLNYENNLSVSYPRIVFNNTESKVSVSISHCAEGNIKRTGLCIRIPGIANFELFKQEVRARNAELRQLGLEEFEKVINAWRDSNRHAAWSMNGTVATKIKF